MVPYRSIGLILPFLVVAYIHWTHSIQRDHNSQLRSAVTPSRAQRDRLLSRKARARWLHQDALHSTVLAKSHDDPRPAGIQANVEQPKAEGKPEAKEWVRPSRESVNSAEAVDTQEVVREEGQQVVVVAAAAGGDMGVSDCPENRRPYHVLLTATSQVRLAPSW